VSALQAQFEALALHVRDPQAHPGPPGIEPRRLQVYRELLYNNLDGLLAGTFPVIRRTVGDNAWASLVRGFLARHRSSTPLFPELGREFTAFLASAAGHDPARPWLPELAHYEWAEVGLQLSDETIPPHDPAGDLLDGVPLLSPLAWALAYRWPVARIGPEHQPLQPPEAPTLVLLRRDPAGRVHFSALSPLLYRLLELIGATRGDTGRALLARLAAEAGQHDFDGFLAQAVPMLDRLRAEGVVPGTRTGAPGGSASLSG
jgi:hypothetical protein